MASPTNLCALFAKAVRSWPENLAVDHPDGSLTYQELDYASSAVANDLVELGVTRGTVVLLLTAHGSFNIVAILAILKAGACFIPIDRRRWSQNTILYVYNIVESPVVVNTTLEPFELPLGTGQMLHITSLPAHNGKPNQLQNSFHILPESTACIIFTSGSTGRPKGVMISHRSLCLYSKTSPVNMDIVSGDRLLHILSVGFDGGETASPDLLGSWVDAGVKVLTAYGATETTALGCIQEVKRDIKSGEINPFVIGGALEQSPVWLLKDDLTAIDEEYVDGEMIIAGDGLSEGYYKEEIKSTESFFTWNGFRVYRTGDYGRWVPGAAGDRVIEFRGRADRTVKNHGFLVNLDQDVENELLRIGSSLGVRSVHAASTANGIVAVITPSNVNITLLLEKANRSMCSYFVPYRIEATETIPLSPNGKVQTRQILNIVASNNDRQIQMDEGASKDVNLQKDDDTGDDHSAKLQIVLRAASEVFDFRLDKVKTLAAEDSFNEMGGSSLLALKFVFVLRQLGVQSSVRDIFKYQTFSRISNHASVISCSSHVKVAKDAEDEGVADMLANLRVKASDLLGLYHDSFDVGPLTSFQLELALPTLVDDSRYVNQLKLAYSGTQADAMERAWRLVWQTEPIFRTEISLAIGSGVLIVHKKSIRKPKTQAYGSCAEYREAVETTSTAVGLGCSLTFYRCGLEEEDSVNGREGAFSLDEEERLTVVLTIHHCLMDGCSLELILGNVEKAALGLSLPPSISTINMNLRLISIQQTRDEEARKFFINYLDGFYPQKDKTAHHGIQQAQPENRRHATAVFEASVTREDAVRFARQEGVSVACLYFTAWAMAISVLEGSATVAVGSVFSSRGGQPGQENAVGAYISTIPLLFKLTEEETVTSLLQRTMDDITMLGKYAWARSDQIGIGSSIGNLLAVQPSLPDEHPRTRPLRVESVDNSDVPLALLIEPDGHFRILFDASKFTHGLIRRVGDNFKFSLYGVIHEKVVRDCMRLNNLQESLIHKAEEVRISPDCLCLKQALEHSVDRFAHLVGLEDCAGTRLTYGELDRLSNTIAHRLSGSSAGNAIAVHGDGTVEWILGLLGVVKSGRTFVPIDPKWPIDHRAKIIEAVGSTSMLLSHETQRNEAPALPGLEVLFVDSMLSTLSGTDEESRLPDAASLESDVAVIFTSGTTGAPKGIPISNRGLLACQGNLEGSFFASPGRRIAQFMSPAFDVCILEVFGTLLHGATLVLRDRMDPYAHLTRSNTVAATPSALAVMDLDELPGIDLIVSAGEPLTGFVVNKFSTRALLYNAYGPAECTVLASVGRMLPGDSINVGPPFDTVRFYILDEDRNEVPDGMRGEIYVAGAQLMRGDYGFRGRDGRLRCLGRIDRVVKIRGLRVELAAVEQAIISYGGVIHCAVIAVNGVLVAYVTLDRDHGRTETETEREREREREMVDIRRRLGETMASSWVPSAIVPLEQLPKNSNGKVDCRALEVMYSESISSAGAAVTNSSSSGIARKLAEQWRQVLQLASNAEFVDDDDFLRLGGHSILLMLLSTRLTAAFGTNIKARELVATTSFRGHINAVQLQLDSTSSDGQETTSANMAPEELTELERQVWFQYQVATTVTTFNIATVLQLSGRVDVDKLLRSLDEALASDPVLSSNMTDGPNGLKRVISASAPQAREVRHVDMEAEVNYRFDLEHDALIRVHLVRGEDSTARPSLCQLILVTSHAIADLGTLQNLLRLTSLAYAGGKVTRHDTPQHLGSRKWTHRPSPEERMFWRNYLSGHSYDDNRSSLLRRTFLLSPLATFQGASRSLEFSGRLVTSLNKLIRRLGVTHHQMALAVGAILLQWLSKEDDIVLGAPNANRSSPRDEEALGQFLDRLPIRVRLPKPSVRQSETAISTVLLEVRSSALRALAHAISFSDILAIHGFPNGHLHHPLFECMVTFHVRSSGLENWLQLPGCKVSASSRFANGSKFPLMLEWFELGPDRWSVHLEHDTSYIPSGSMEGVEKALGIILRAMSDDHRMSELQNQLGDLKVSTSASSEESAPSTPDYDSPRSSDSCYSASVEEMATTIRTEMTACLGSASKSLSNSGSFFSAGADSMAVMSLRHRMRKLGIDLPVRSIFVGRTPLKLAELVLL
ncbi:nrps [Metarhizium rileyi]|uniref:Nrps n=1 Tax=Metarhizium rileyi (strain RCEF 4871) TaxID=1649241 RepID=A0A5C6GDD8_METRR|nr:nrps [Metarhizium rileyi]